MPFIGQQPITGAYSVLDDITTSATATYNLQLNSAAYSPASANNLLVSLNGVIQKPGSSFTISGSQITFSSALTSSDSIDFIIALGDVLSVGTPTDGSVGTASLAPSAVTDAKLASTLDLSGKTVTYGLSNTDLPVGTVVQTKHYGYGNGNTGFNQNIAANLTSGQTVTLGSGTITPTSSSNKILVFGTNLCHNDTNSGYSYFRIIRSLGGSDSILMNPGNAVGFQYPSGARIPVPFNLLDNPGTTSEITYTQRVDHHGLTVDQTWSYGGVVGMTLMEIAL